MVNARLLQQSVLRRFQAATGQTVKGSAFLFSGLTRLAVITGVVFGVILFLVIFLVPHGARQVAMVAQHLAGRLKRR